MKCTHLEGKQHNYTLKRFKSKKKAIYDISYWNICKKHFPIIQHDIY